MNFEWFSGEVVKREPNKLLKANNMGKRAGRTKVTESSGPISLFRMEAGRNRRKMFRVCGKRLKTMIKEGGSEGSFPGTRIKITSADMLGPWLDRIETSPKVWQ